MIVEHWIRPAHTGGVECYMHTASGVVLSAKAPTTVELRRAIERWLTLTEVPASQEERGEVSA